MARTESVSLTGFKRFAQLTINHLPETAKLVVLAGPNGFGKSSLFDSFRVWVGHHANRTWHNDPSYYARPDAATQAVIAPLIRFYGEERASGTLLAKKAFWFRTAYRNDPVLYMNQLSRVQPLLEEQMISRMIEGDAAVSSNYMRLVSAGIEDAFGALPREMSLGEFRDSAIGNLIESIKRLFPDLVLNSLGSPLEDPTFRFTKGTSGGFDYKNLSGGEKAVFDLLLDLFIKRREYDDTVYCIDEPEAHTNPRIQGSLLREMLRIIPANCQLWIATHAIGMLRAARDIGAESPGTVVFLDFEG